MRVGQIGWAVPNDRWRFPKMSASELKSCWCIQLSMSQEKEAWDFWAWTDGAAPNHKKGLFGRSAPVFVAQDDSSFALAFAILWGNGYRRPRSTSLLLKRQNNLTAGKKRKKKNRTIYELSVWDWNTGRLPPMTGNINTSKSTRNETRRHE